MADITDERPAILASWVAPSWADTSERDDEALIHSRPIGTVCDLDGDLLSVEVVQRDEMVFALTDVSVQRTPPYIRISGQRVDGVQAGILSELLITAGRLVSNS